MRGLLRWWYQWQTAKLDSEAERIREGLLQELFAVRRSLELALLSDRIDIKEVQQWLAQIETLQQALETVMHRLSPPYLDDSLPLAIQHLLKHWQAEYPAVCLELNLPDDWYQDSIDQHRIILTVLDEWLRLIMPQLRSEAVLHISLQQQATSRQLSIQLTAPTVSGLLSSSAIPLDNLQQFFQALTEGKCYCQRRGLTVTWCYQWRSTIQLK
jgi:ribosomal protein L29